MVRPLSPPELNKCHKVLMQKPTARHLQSRSRSESLGPGPLRCSPHFHKLIELVRFEISRFVLIMTQRYVRAADPSDHRHFLRLPLITFIDQGR